MTKVLMKGNEALGAAAIKAGCKYFFWISDYAAKRITGIYG
jgi:pyruvate/2-oxoacid:ferredoxin oxidoreductase alpha subunit